MICDDCVRGCGGSLAGCHCDCHTLEEPSYDPTDVMYEAKTVLDERRDDEE